MMMQRKSSTTAGCRTGREWTLILALVIGTMTFCAHAQETEAPEPYTEILDDDAFDAEGWDAEDGAWDANPVRDYIEPVNRVFFVVNDKFYYYALKPVSRGYGAIVPESPRKGVTNFFSNLGTPARLVNCLLQRDLRGCGTELSRFVVNTTWGVLGIGDPAANRLSIQRRDADLGQTLGMYAFPEVTYINLPILGPSNVRDTVGRVGDSFLDPVSLLNPWYWRAAVKGGEQVNRASFPLSPYKQLEELKADPATFDFYISVRNAYTDSRRYFIDQADARLTRDDAATDPLQDDTGPMVTPPPPVR